MRFLELTLHDTVVVLATIIVLLFSCIPLSIKVKQLVNQVMVIPHKNRLQTALRFMQAKKRQDEVEKNNFLQEDALPYPG